MRNIDPNHYFNPNFILGQECYIGESCCDAGADNKTTQRRPLTEYRSMPGFMTRCSVDLQTQRRFVNSFQVFGCLQRQVYLQKEGSETVSIFTEIGHCSSVQACHPNSLCRPLFVVVHPPRSVELHPCFCISEGLEHHRWLAELSCHSRSVHLLHIFLVQDETPLL
jgi:hypothetical protein